MGSIKKLPLAAILCMAIFSLTGIFGLIPGGKNLTGLTIVVGIPMYFIAWKTEKSDDLLDFKAIPGVLKHINVLIWLLLPMVMNAVCNVIAKRFLPEFIEHLNMRAGFLHMDKIPLLLIELVVTALGEEIAWRAFFQNQLTKAIPFVPALIVSSALFAICHCTQGTAAVVLYDLLFVFINALIYGIVFRKTNNAFVSALSHFMANLFGIVHVLFWL